VNTREVIPVRELRERFARGYVTAFQQVHLADYEKFALRKYVAVPMDRCA